MIIRSFAARQGRRALFAPPLRQACQRALSTTESTTTATPPSPSQAPSSESSSQSADGATTQPGAAWGQRSGDRPDTIAQDYITMTKLQRKTSKLGASVQRRYVPGDLLRDPPYPKDISLEMLMAAQTHMGHHTSLWNPANARYIHGVRADVHVIALEQTATHLRRAARVVEEIAYRGGLILFAGTRKGQMEIVVRAAELAGGCHLFTKWTPGTITNRDEILRHGRLRVVDELDRDRTADGFEAHLEECRPLAPDLVVVLNPMENFVLLRECAGASVPTIGVIDTDADPGRVTYAIPANDDSLRSVATIAGVLGRAGELGQKRRLRDALDGVVAWENGTEIVRYMVKQNKEGEPPVAGKPWILSGGRVYN